MLSGLRFISSSEEKEETLCLLAGTGLAGLCNNNIGNQLKDSSSTFLYFFEISDIISISNGLMEIHLEQSL